MSTIYSYLGLGYFTNVFESVLYLVGFLLSWFINFIVSLVLKTFYHYDQQYLFSNYHFLQLDDCTPFWFNGSLCLCPCLCFWLSSYVSIYLSARFEFTITLKLRVLCVLTKVSFGSTSPQYSTPSHLTVHLVICFMTFLIWVILWSRYWRNAVFLNEINEYLAINWCSECNMSVEYLLEPTLLYLREFYVSIYSKYRLTICLAKIFFYLLVCEQFTFGSVSVLRSLDCWGRSCVIVVWTTYSLQYRSFGPSRVPYGESSDVS